MAELPLASVLNSLVYPTTVRISSGSLTVEEGKHFRPYNVLTLYGSGFRVYVPPSANAALRERSRTSDATERTRRRSSDVHDEDEYINTDNLFTKNIFVSEKTDVKDNKFAGKVYRDVAELLSDSPSSVKANKPFFVCGNEKTNEIRKISEGEVICIDLEMDKVKRNILRGHVDGERVSIQLSNTSISVTALPESNSETTACPAAHMMNGNFGLPKELVFEDQDVQDTYQIEVGFNVIPLRERPILSVCCSEGYHRNAIEELDTDILKIKNIWCFDVREQSIQTVTVQILDTDTESHFNPTFGKEVGRDDDGFSLYNLYGKVCSEDYLEPTTSIPRLPQTKTGASARVTDEPPPLPKRSKPSVKPSTRRSITLNSLPYAPLPPPHDLSMKLPQKSSPTFVKSQFSEEDVPTSPLLSGLDHSVPDQSGPNSTDEQKMSPIAEFSTVDTSSHNTPSDVPGDSEIDTKDIKDMTISELSKLFRKNRLDHMADVCEEEVIDGLLLLEYDEHDYQREPFNLDVYHLKRLKKLIEGHRPK